VEDRNVPDNMSARLEALSQIFDEIPPYDSVEFWQVVEQANFPHEVLVKILRSVPTTSNSEMICQRLLAIIVMSIQKKNEAWACDVLKRYPCGNWDMLYNLCMDLCADLNEEILKDIINPQRPFWEKNFAHSLHYKRKHVLRSLMRREGYLARLGKGNRIPRSLLFSLDQHFALYSDSFCNPFDIEDEKAYTVMHAMDSSFLIDFVEKLPQRLSSVVMLVFWADKTERDIAKLLNVTERTVRNRLKAAIDRLYNTISNEADFVMILHQYLGK
jgi:RNA polymerase sigma factor (sigma-70 family)